MLYYHKDSYELQDLPDSLVQGWVANNNPKMDYWILAPDKPAENYVWNKGVWEVIVPTIPQSISARQVRLWLVRNGISLDMVNQAINNIQDPIMKDNVAIEWEYAPYIERNHPMLLPLAQSLGLNEADIDRAFIEGVSI